MYISEGQIKSVIETLKKNEYKLSDGYIYYYAYDEEANFRPDTLTGEALDNFDLDVVLREVAIEIISNLNKVIYNGT